MHHLVTTLSHFHAIVLVKYYWIDPIAFIEGRSLSFEPGEDTEEVGEVIAVLSGWDLGLKKPISLLLL